MDIAQNQQNNINVVRYDYVPVDCLISSVRGPTVTDVLYVLLTRSQIINYDNTIFFRINQISVPSIYYELQKNYYYYSQRKFRVVETNLYVYYVVSFYRDTAHYQYLHFFLV